MIIDEPKKKLGNREVDTSYMACYGNKIVLKRNETKQSTLCKVHTTCSIGQEIISHVKNQFNKAKAKAKESEKKILSDIIKYISNAKQLIELDEYMKGAKIIETKNKIDDIMKTEAMVEIKDIKFPVYVYFDNNNVPSLKSVKGYITKIIPTGCMCYIKTEDGKHEFECGLSNICFDKTCEASNNLETDINIDKKETDRLTISIDVINKLASSVSKTINDNIKIHKGGTIETQNRVSNNVNVVDSQEFECD